MGVSFSPVAFGAPYNPIVSPGSGRARSYVFPEFSYLQAGLSRNVVGSRPGAGPDAAPTFAPAIYTADPGAVAGPVIYNGVNVATQIAAVGQGKSYAFPGIFPRLAPNNITVDDLAYWRIIFQIALGNPPGGAATDIGGYIVQAGSATPDLRVVAGTIQGFGIQFSNFAGQGANFVIRGPNGLVTLNLPQVPDTSVIHAYELLITPSTPTQYATLQLLLDSNPITLPALSSSWAPGTNLPPLVVAANFTGFAAGLINNTGASCNLLMNATAGCTVVAAPTLQDLY